jgi:transcriptional regulator with XRE-family HTH domain
MPYEPGGLSASQVRSSLFLAVATKVTSVSRPDTARFGAIVNKRRRELGLSLDDVAASGGPSQVTVSNIEQGSTNRPHFGTFTKLDAVLKWKPGSAARAFDGQEPEAFDEQGRNNKRRPQTLGLNPDSVTVSMRTVGDLLTAAQKIERIASSETASPELKDASSELDLHVDRVMRAWIIVQVEARLCVGDDLQNDVMIDMFLKDYLSRASEPATAEDEAELGYLQWLLGKADDLSPDREHTYQERWNATRSEY